MSIMSYLAPFTRTARNIATTARTGYDLVTSDSAKQIYQAVWTLAQITFWSMVLAAIATTNAGQRFRAYYEQEWASNVNQAVEAACRQAQQLYKQVQTAAATHVHPRIQALLETAVTRTETGLDALQQLQPLQTLQTLQERFSSHDQGNQANQNQDQNQGIIDFIDEF